MQAMGSDEQDEPAKLAAKGPRFVVRPLSRGFSVVDIWTGETAVIAMTPQADLSEQDAVHTAAMLNGRVWDGDRSIPQ